MRRPIAALVCLVSQSACAGDSTDALAPRLHAVGEGSLALVMNDLPSCTATVALAAPTEPSVRVALDPASGSSSVTLPGLVAGTTYGYGVETCGVTTARGAFTTPPARHASAPTRFAVFADSQDAPSIFGVVLAQIAAWAPDFVVGAGDYVQVGTDPARWRDEFARPVSALGANVPLVLARGNHDGEGELANAYLPAPNPYHALSWGHVRLVVLDTNLPLGEGSAERAWLAAELGSRAFQGARYRVVVQHEPLFAEGWSGTPYMPRATFDGLDALYSAAGVSVVISGHAHDYERGARGGVTYVITGGAGGELDQQQEDLPEITRYEARHHHLEVEATDASMTLRARDAITGEAFDSIAIAPAARR